MATCIIDQGYDLGCFGSAGVSRVLISTYAPDAVYAAGATAGYIETVTGNNQYYVYQQEIETASLSQTTSVNRQGGSVKFSQTVELTLQGLNINTRNVFSALAKAPLNVIVEDNNGNYWLIGEKNGARIDSAEFSTGVALDDPIGAVITILGAEPEAAQMVDPTLIATLIVAPV